MFDFQLDNPNDAIQECNEALKIDENDVDALCDRAEAHILNEMYDEGTKMPFLISTFHVTFTSASLSFALLQIFTILICVEVTFDVFRFDGLSAP